MEGKKLQHAFVRGRGVLDVGGGPFGHFLARDSIGWVRGRWGTLAGKLILEKVLICCFCTFLIC